MEINKIAIAPVYTRKNTEKTSFGAYRLAPQWQPFLNEIQNNAARKCLSNMDGDFFRKLAQDLNNLMSEKINLTKIIEAAKSRIKCGTEYNEKAMDEFNKLTKKISSKIENPSDVDIIVSKPYWGMTRLENAGETYPAKLNDSFIDLIIPGTDYKYSHKLGTQGRYFTDLQDDDFHFARKLWNNTDDSEKSPYKRMFDDFTEALINGFVDLYKNMNKATNKGTGKIAPNFEDKPSNNRFIYFY